MLYSNDGKRWLTSLGMAGLMALTLPLTGCGSDSDDSAAPAADSSSDANNNGKNEVVAIRVPTLEYFTGTLMGEDTLFAVPPSQPTAFEAIDREANTRSTAFYTFGIVPLLAAESVTATSANGLHVESVVYSRRDGTLWRVSTDPDLFPPAPVRVSSADKLERICMHGVNSPVLYADSDATPLVYGMPMPGDGCSDANNAASMTWHYVLAGDGAAVAPRPFAAPDPLPGDDGYGHGFVTPTIVNLLDAEHSNAGWLIRQNGMLTRVGPDGTVTVPDIHAVVESFKPVAPQLSSGVIVLAIDGELKAFDPADNSLTDLNTESGGPLLPFFASSDGAMAYLVQRDGGLYRTTDGGRAVVKIDELASGMADYVEPFVGMDHVVWVAEAPEGGLQLRSVEKSATDVGTGEVIATFGDDALGRITGHSGQWLFYTERDFSGGTTVLSAVAQRMDGSTREAFINAQWVGATRASAREVGNGGNVSRVYRVDGVTGPGDSLAGKALFSVPADDPANVAATVGLGTISGEDLRMFTPGFGPGRLAATGTAAGETDITYFNDSEAMSLQTLPLADADPFPLPRF